MAELKAFTGTKTSSTNRSLSDFKAKLTGGGTRSNLFRCEISFPTASLPAGVTEVNTDVELLVKAANLPASTINPISVPFRGRELKIAGDRTFEPWQITVINDTNFNLRSSFERWMNLVNKNSDNAGTVDPTQYQSVANVYQLGRAPMTTATASNDATPILRIYKFYGIFPTTVSSIPLSFSDNSNVQEFTVDLQVQWWETFDPAGNGIAG